MTQEKTLARLQWEQAVENEDFAQADKLFFKLNANYLHNIIMKTN